MGTSGRGEGGGGTGTGRTSILAADAQVGDVLMSDRIASEGTALYICEWLEVE